MTFCLWLESSRRDTNPAFSRRVSRSARMFEAIRPSARVSTSRKWRRLPNIRSRMTIRLQRSPSASRVRLIGQPERGAFMRTPKTNCDMKSVDLAYNRLHNAIRTARMCRVRKGSGMARLVFGMNQSLDGYVDHMAFAPSPTLFRHFIEEAQGQAGSVYGRHMYELLRLISKGAIRKLKAERDGEIEVAGPHLAQSLTELGLIDQYRIYLHPVVLGHGKPYFAGPRPPLRLGTHDRIGEDVIRLTYVPALVSRLAG